MSATIITILAVLIAIVLFATLHRQTMRADRAEAALARINETLAACEHAVIDVQVR
jgi:hypothetical protein